MANDSGELNIGVLNVHRLGFGTMRLTGPGVWGPPRDRDEAIKVLRRCVDLDVNLFDTADSYGPNVAEELIFEALHPYPEDLVIATKAGFTRSGPDVWKENGDPAYLRSQCEGSMQRLGVDQIDLFQLHRIDPRVPADEQFGVLKALRDEGKVREVGLSEVRVKDIEAARNVVPIASVQNQYSIAQRNADDVVEYCEENGIAFLPWNPLGRGRLTESGGPLDDVATQLGATPSQVAIAWLLRRSPIMVPIPGTSTVVHLEENCAAAQVVLSDEQFSALDGSRKSLRRWSLGH
jgi:aryl-alcohol dehydrogenase-like predicted oxidoreductase